MKSCSGQFIRFAPVSAAAVIAVLSMALAGPLNPPAGPVSGTYKTMAEVEPRVAISATNTPGDATCLFKITAPGSYYLTGNVTGVAGKHGIGIAADNVTIDLNGYELAGVPGMGAFAGVAPISTQFMSFKGIAILNGSIRGWGFGGFCSGYSGGSFLGCRLNGVRALGNTGVGISLDFGSVATNCIASYNTGGGIAVGGGSIASGCTSYNNTQVGFDVGNDALVDRCSAYSNDVGVRGLDSATVTNCTVSSNRGDGIQCRSLGVIRDNTCSHNGIANGVGAGIHVLNPGLINRIEGNTCYYNMVGIQVSSPNNLIIKNTCGNNPQAPVSGSANWDIAANNAYGPIVDRRAPVSAAVQGNSGPGSLTTTDPNANFSY